MKASEIRVALLGELSIDGPAGPVNDSLLGGRKGRIAFGLLVRSRGRPVAKSELADAVWLGTPPPTWEPALRSVISRVRSFLAAAGLPAAELLTAASGCYQLRLPEAAIVDAEEAAAEVDEAETALRAGDLAEAASKAEGAAAILVRTPLPAEDGEWLDQFRTELSTTRLRALETLAAANLACGRIEDALAATDEAIALDPFRESLHRLAMATHAKAGSRGAALRAYERCRHLLAEELGVRPSEETEAAYLQLLGEEPSTPARDQFVSRPTLPVPSAADGPALGRDEELATGATAFEMCRKSHRQALLIGGEAGGGKTTLALAIAAEAQDSGATALYGRCSEGGAAPYEPIVEALERLFAELTIEELTSLVGQTGTAALRLSPRAAARVPDVEPANMADPESDRSLLFSSVAALLSLLAVQNPVVLLLEDLHWAGVPTLHFVHSLVRSTVSASVLVLLTFRSDEVADYRNLEQMLAALRREPGVTSIELAGLPREAVRDVVVARGDADDALVDAIFARTDGNPLFVTELLEDMKSAATSVPETVRGLVDRRVDLLSRDARRVTSLAAVAGENVDAVLLARASALSADELLDALDEACRHRLLAESERGSYRFRHALFRDAIYEGMGATRRALLHLRLGELLERPADTGAGAPPAILADHFAAAGSHAPRGKAVQYATAAGDRAVQMTAYEEAVLHYSRARDLLGPGDREGQCELLIRLGDAQRRAGDQMHRASLLDACALAQQLRDDERYVRAVLANHRGFWTAEGQPDQEKIATLEHALKLTDSKSPDYARVMSVLSMELTFSRDHQARRFALSDRALATARASGDNAVLADVLAQRIMTLRTPANVYERLRLCGELRELVPLVGGQDRQASAACWHCIAAIEVGDLATANEALSSAFEAAPPSRGFGWFLKSLECNLVAIRGNLERAEDLSLAALQIAQDVGEPDAKVLHVGRLSAVRLQQGRMGELADDVAEFAAKDPATVYGAVFAVASLDLGDRDQAISLVRSCVHDGRLRLTTTVQWTLTTTLLSLAVARIGDRDVARVLYGELRPYADLLAASSQGTYGSVEHYLGLLALTRGEPHVAERHFAAAQDKHRRIGATGLLAWSLVRGVEARLESMPLDRADVAALDEAVGVARALHIEALESRARRLS